MSDHPPVPRPVPPHATNPPHPLPGARFIGGVALLLLSVLPIEAGAAMPAWINRLGDVTGIGGEHAARWLASIFFTAGLLALLWPAAAATALTIGGIIAAFCGVTTLAGASVTGGGTLAIAAITTAVGVGVALGLAGRIGPRADRAHARRGASPAWQVLSSMALFGLVLSVAARVPVKATEALVTLTPFGQNDPATAALSVQMVNFEFDSWEGRSLAETGLYNYLPQLAPLIGDGTVFLVFYNPRCSHCHELFEAHFSGHLSVPVIAIEIPPPPGGTVIETDEPTEINCPECQRLTLPSTHAWGVTPPAVVRIEDGIVRCAGEANALTPKDCIGAAAVR